MPCRSPMSPLVCSPPTPCPLRPRLRFPLPWPTSWRTLVLCLMARRHVRPQNVSCVGDGSPALRSTGVSSRKGEGLPGYETVLFVRAMVEHPAGYTPRLAQFAPGIVVAFVENQHSRHPGSIEVSGPQSHGPHVRMPTHRRPCFHDRRKASYRLGRAHPWPGGFCTRWTMNEVSWWHRFLQFPSTHRAWSLLIFQS